MGSKFTDIFTKDNLPFFKREAEIKSTNSPSSSNSPFFVVRGLDGQIFAFRTVAIADMINNYRQIAPLNTAVEILAEAVAGLPCVLKRKSDGVIVRDHPFLTFLKNPNDDTQKTRADFFHDIVFWKLIAGDAYISATGRVNNPALEAFVLGSNFVTPVAGEQGFVQRYNFDSSFGQSSFQREETMKGAKFYNEDRTAELYDIMRFNPRFNSSNLRGMSAIESLFFEFNQYLFGSRHNLSLLTNGARPSGAFVLESKKDGTSAMLSDEAYDRLKNEIQTSYVGATNSGRPLVLEGGMKWQQISVSPKDMDFKALKEDAEKQIYKNLRVPIEIVMAEGTTFDNRESARLQFYEDTIIPMALNIYEHLDRFLLSRYKDGDDFDLVVDLQHVPALLPLQLERRKTIESSIVLTVNEKREELGKDSIEGGDKITDPNGRPIAGPDAETTVGESENSASSEETEEENT